MIRLTSNKYKKSNHKHLSFYSDEMFVTKEYLIEHHLKLTYQRQLIANLDSKHKEWSKNLKYLKYLLL